MKTESMIGIPECETTDDRWGLRVRSEAALFEAAERYQAFGLPDNLGTETPVEFTKTAFVYRLERPWNR